MINEFYIEAQRSFHVLIWSRGNSFIFHEYRMSWFFEGFFFVPSEETRKIHLLSIFLVFIQLILTNGIKPKRHIIQVNLNRNLEYFSLRNNFFFFFFVGVIPVIWLMLSLALIWNDYDIILYWPMFFFSSCLRVALI